MSSSHLFQDFGTLKAAKVGKQSLTIDEIEELKLQAFESGYKAGWEDADGAQSDSLTHVSAELASSLQSASFEYHELRATMNAAVQSIMADVVEKILPAAAQASLGAHIRDFVTGTVREALDKPIEIAVAPASEDAVRAVLSSDLQDPFKLVTSANLSPNQAMLQLGKAETELNLDKMMAEIAAAITTYFETQKPEVTDGGPA